VEASAIPEPATYALVLLALAAMRVLSRGRSVRRV
jgi:PEP-CTERM motif